MKSRLFLLCVASLTVLAFSTLPTKGATVVKFDELTDTGSGSVIPNGYQGLVWANFGVRNAILLTNLSFGVNGYYYGMVSVSNVAYNSAGAPAEIDSAGMNFNFLSAYLTGVWNSNLNIEVEGFRSGALVYDKIVVAGATNATLFTFDYMDVDCLYFDSFGGQDAGFSTVYGGEHFAADNLTFEFIPEPSSLLLTACGALALRVLLKRRRA